MITVEEERKLFDLRKNVNDDNIRIKEIIKEKIGDFKSDNGEIIINAPNGEQDLAIVLGKLKDVIEIESVSLLKPSLDDVFLHYTGKNLRD